MKLYKTTTFEPKRRSFYTILTDAAKTVKEAGFLKPAMDLEIAAMDCLDSPVTKESVVHTLYSTIETITDKGGVETAKGLIDFIAEAYVIA